MIGHSIQIVLSAGIAWFMPCLLAAFPADEALYPSVDGWKRSDSIKVFTPDNLYNFIDGAADAYLMQDFERLTVAYYTRGDTSVTVEIYKHRTEENAYGMYVQERSSPTAVLTIGIEGYYAETVLNFVIGKTYVKLTSYTLGRREKDVLEKIARRVSGNIGGTTAVPLPLGCFPREEMIAGSERFIGKDFLGYTFFRSGYSADYRIGSTAFQMFMIKETDSLSCSALHAIYLRTIKQSFDSSMPRPVHDPYWGSVSLRQSGRMLLGLIGEITPEKTAALLSRLDSNLRVLKASQ